MCSNSVLCWHVVTLISWKLLHIYTTTALVSLGRQDVGTPYCKRTKLLCPSKLLRGARLYKPMHAHCGALAHAHTYCCSAEELHCYWGSVGDDKPHTPTTSICVRPLPAYASAMG